MWLCFCSLQPVLSPSTPTSANKCECLGSECVPGRTNHVMLPCCVQAPTAGETSWHQLAAQQQTSWPPHWCCCSCRAENAAEATAAAAAASHKWVDHSLQPAALLYFCCRQKLCLIEAHHRMLIFVQAVSISACTALQSLATASCCAVVWSSVRALSLCDLQAQQQQHFAFWPGHQLWPGRVCSCLRVSS